VALDAIKGGAEVEWRWWGTKSALSVLFQ